MRKAILALAVTLASATEPLQAKSPKAPPADVGVGRVAWFDITTTNVARSKEFYGKLFNWQFGPVAGSDQVAEIQTGGQGIGTIRGADGPIGGFNGVVYIQVADIQASCNKVTVLGGKVVPGFPFNLPDGTGAIAVFVDPSGHPLGMYRGRHSRPRRKRSRTGSGRRLSARGRKWHCLRKGRLLLPRDGPHLYES